MDKLVDELAKGQPMEKILRSGLQGDSFLHQKLLRVTSHEIIESAKLFENPQSNEILQYAEIWFSDSDNA